MVSKSLSVRRRGLSRYSRIKVCSGLTLACLLFSPHVAKANTYYVSPSGSDSNSGSSSAPFRTLQQAADTVNAGDIVIVRQGNYKGFIMGWDYPTAGTEGS